MAARRRVLRRAVAIGTLGLAGCSGGGGGPGPTATPTDETTTTPPPGTTTPEPTPTPTAGGRTVDVAAGPEGRLRFVPETVEIAAGDTVRWTFESPGHNVTSKPGASEKVRVPEGAEPFASYEGDRHFATNEVGTTYEHPFTVPGEYVYVCAPHADQGMVGTVVVDG